MEALRAKEKELLSRKEALESKLAAKEALCVRQRAYISRAEAFKSRMKEFHRRDHFLDDEVLWSLEDERYRDELLELASCFRFTKILNALWSLLQKKEKPNSWLSERPSDVLELLATTKEHTAEADIISSHQDVAVPQEGQHDDHNEQENDTPIAEICKMEARFDKFEDELSKAEAALAVREEEWRDLVNVASMERLHRDLVRSGQWQEHPGERERRIAELKGELLDSRHSKSAD